MTAPHHGQRQLRPDTAASEAPTGSPSSLRTFLDSWLPWIAFLLGACGILIFTFRQSQRDRALAERKRPTPAPELPAPAACPTVSVLVAAWNEADFIERHIASVLALRYPSLEYILCAGGSDGTYELARRISDPRLTVLPQPAGMGKQWALRQCFERSTGAVLFLTDAGCVLTDAAFEATLQPIIAEGESAATGSYRPLPEQLSLPFVVNQWAVEVYGRAAASEYVGGLIGRNAAIHRDLALACGGFTAVVPTGTDYHLAQQILATGHKIRFVAQSEVPTHFETSFSTYQRQQSRWLKNILIHGVTFRAWQQVSRVLMLYMVGVAVVSLPLASLIVSRFLFVIWALGMMLSMANRVRYLTFAARLKRVTLTWRTYASALLYGPLDLYVVFLSILDLLHPRRRRRW